jgi:glutamine phosphoribosylpyrophosphate amidotransferase
MSFLRPVPTPDRFHDECGVVGISGHPEAANVAYLALYALQHRGQESACILSRSGSDVHLHRGMVLVADIVDAPTLERHAARSGTCATPPRARATCAMRSPSAPRAAGCRSRSPTTAT